MWSAIIILTIALYFPMFGKIVPVVQDLPFNFLYYSIALLIISTLIKILSEGKRYHISPTVKYLFWFNVYFFVNISIKTLFAAGAMQQTFSRTAGPLFAICFILFMFQSKFVKQKEVFLKHFSTVLGIVLILQTAISAYESITDTTLGDYEIKVFLEGVSLETKAYLEGRDILNVFNLSQVDLFGFQIPFKGLIGQHNAFGSMLVFYNIIFLFDYLKHKRVLTVIFLVVTVFAIVGNTTRMAMVSILLSDMIVFLYLINRPWLRRFIIICGILLLVLFGLDFYFKLDEIFVKTNTLLGRFDIWQYLINNYFYSTSLWALLIGLSGHELLKVGTTFIGRTLGSFENQFFSVYLLTGGIGLYLFIYSFFWIPKKCLKKLPSTERIIMVTLILSALLTSLTLDCILHYSSYGLFLIIYLLLTSSAVATEKYNRITGSNNRR